MSRVIEWGGRIAIFALASWAGYKISQYDPIPAMERTARASVYADAGCGYCRDLSVTVARYGEGEIFILPVGGQDSYPRLVTQWCQDAYIRIEGDWMAGIPQWFRTDEQSCEWLQAKAYARWQAGMIAGEFDQGVPVFRANGKWVGTGVTAANMEAVGLPTP